ncbi:MAG TPA: hypothetical protein VGC31_09010 [Paenirhodobacter sp.]
MSKDNFTTEEWNQVLAAPMLVGMSISAADPGGLFSAFQESAAVAKAVASGVASEGLIAEVAQSYKNTEARHGVVDTLKTVVAGKKTAPEIMAAAIAELGQIAALVAAKATTEAPGFSAWLLQIAQAVAEAGKEGGFLGFGGVAVSTDETAALAKLHDVLGATGTV